MCEFSVKNGMPESYIHTQNKKVNLVLSVFLFSLFRWTYCKFIQYCENFILYLQVRDLSIAYMLVTLTYLYIGILVFASFPSPPLPKDCIEQVRHMYPLCVIVSTFILAEQAWRYRSKIIIADRTRFEYLLYFLFYIWEFRHLPHAFWTSVSSSI